MNLTGALQENVLTLLCFDKQAAALITSQVDVELFENAIYRNIAKVAVGYFRKFKKPCADHLPDLLEDYLSEPKKAKLYSRALNDLKDLSQSVNAEYVLSELHKFVRRQTMRKAITEAAAQVQQDDLDKAESIILKGVRSRMEAFHVGIKVGDARNLDRFTNLQIDGVGTGIRELDTRGIMPARKELFTFVAPRNKGKTWFLVQSGRFASMQNWKVLHITLEMGELLVWQRYLQAFFSLNRREGASVEIPQFVRSKNFGILDNIVMKSIGRRMAISDVSARKKIKARIEAVKGRMNIVIRAFPTSALTTDGLLAYLESLEASEGFVPDVVIVDYPELMKLDTKNLRIDIGRQFKDLRGIAGDRNQAFVVASQSNRDSASAKLITMEHMSEDISKADISDNIVTYSQTKAEEKIQLARLSAAKVRNERKGPTILITQSYSIGQFALDSIAMVTKRYAPILERISPHGDEDD